ncbi:MAG: bis(5'-nucleosyl)-tetraphosphatase (symmetrical) YqeK [Oscillospiraceae bacterium]|nr:bis(5'-nucleosyl)-tetraphosphatase (symmetrical) YqeK [Oscillospiraceae bacterium]
MKEKLKKALSPKRYAHSLGVADEAKRLALKYGADEEKAYTAGLLHDCAKGYSIEEQIELCERLNVLLDDAALQCPPVIHGFLGSVIAKTEYGINDEEILSAIKYHTVGRAGMSLLEKIVYIADMTEVNRDFDGVENLRETLERGLNEALMLSVEQQLKLQTKRRGVIHPNIIYMWNDLLKENGNAK